MSPEPHDPWDVHQYLVAPYLRKRYWQSAMTAFVVPTFITFLVGFSGEPRDYLAVGVLLWPLCFGLAYGQFERARRRVVIDRNVLVLEQGWRDRAHDLREASAAWRDPFTGYVHLMMRGRWVRIAPVFEPFAHLLEVLAHRIPVPLLDLPLERCPGVIAAGLRFGAIRFLDAQDATADTPPLSGLPFRVRRTRLPAGDLFWACIWGGGALSLWFITVTVSINSMFWGVCVLFGGLIGFLVHGRRYVEEPHTYSFTSEAVSATSPLLTVEYPAEAIRGMLMTVDLRAPKDYGYRLLIFHTTGCLTLRQEQVDVNLCQLCLLLKHHYPGSPLPAAPPASTTPATAPRQ